MSLTSGVIYIKAFLNDPSMRYNLHGTPFLKNAMVSWIIDLKLGLDLRSSYWGATFERLILPLDLLFFWFIMLKSVACATYFINELALHAFLKFVIFTSNPCFIHWSFISSPALQNAVTHLNIRSIISTFISYFWKARLISSRKDCCEAIIAFDGSLKSLSSKINPFYNTVIMFIYSIFLLMIAPTLFFPIFSIISSLFNKDSNKEYMSTTLSGLIYFLVRTVTSASMTPLLMMVLSLVLSKAILCNMRKH